MDALGIGRCVPEDAPAVDPRQSGTIYRKSVQFFPCPARQAHRTALIRRISHGYQIAKGTDRDRDARPRCVGGWLILERGHCAASS
jgi:hypothetical protein